MTGKCHHAERLSMFAVGRVKGYQELGLEVGWGPMKLHENHARVALQDDLACTLSNLSTHIAAELVKRNLAFTHALPRRATLLLSPERAQPFIDQLRSDFELWERIQEIDFEGKNAMLLRSVFNLTPVKQLVGLLKLEGWRLTPRPPWVLPLLSPGSADKNMWGCVLRFSSERPLRPPVRFQRLSLRMDSIFVFPGLAAERKGALIVQIPFWSLHL